MHQVIHLLWNESKIIANIEIRLVNIGQNQCGMMATSITFNYQNSVLYPSACTKNSQSSIQHFLSFNFVILPHSQVSKSNQIFFSFAERLKKLSAVASSRSFWKVTYYTLDAFWVPALFSFSLGFTTSPLVCYFQAPKNFQIEIVSLTSNFFVRIFQIA